MMTDIDDQAIALGAVRKGTSSVEDRPSRSYQYGPVRTTRPWADYYFNADGQDIAYCILDLTPRHLHVLEKPRTWCREFLNNLVFSDLLPHDPLPRGLLPDCQGASGFPL